jgi:hypothetical protein
MLTIHPSFVDLYPARGLTLRVLPQVKLLVHSFDPAPGTPIYQNQAIRFIVEPNTDDLVAFVLKVETGGRWEVAYDSNSFSPQYDGSTATRVGSQWHLFVLRKGGWPSRPFFSPIPVANVELV